jgi:hypothetical protein
MLTRHRAKPPGWGSMALPTGQGARRVQFMLRPADFRVLEQVRRAESLDDLAQAVRVCLAGQATRETLAAARETVLLYEELARGAREPRGGGRRRPGGSLSRWSQWVRPADLSNMETIRRARGLASLSEVLRFAVRMEALVRQEQGGDDGTS